MENFKVYRDIQLRTGGDIYIGVVGPVRTGKSTFIRRFMEQIAIPLMEENLQKEIRDQLPVSGSGKTITTCEPKFIPKEAVKIMLGEKQEVNVRLIDCVGFLVKEAAGHVEDGRERMVKTPWSDEPVPFQEAAKTGTQKVIEEHSTIGIVVTTDGSIGEISRENYIEAEELTVKELKKQGKPFIILLNTSTPYKEDTVNLTKELEKKYGVRVIAVNCEQLRKEDICNILECLLYEFPISEMVFYVPKWIEMLENNHEIKGELIRILRNLMGEIKHVRDLTIDSLKMEASFVQKAILEDMDLATGCAKIRIQILEDYYYKILSELSGISISDEYEMIHCMKELSEMKNQYMRVQTALENVRESGYGVVVPELCEVEIKEPEVIRQGNKYGVKIKSKSPSIHMIKAMIETEIAPIVGTEEQANDLIDYIGDSSKRGENIWETNIFGKSIEQLIQDGIKAKILSIGDESQLKLQSTMQKIVNDSKGGLVCIII